MPKRAEVIRLLPAIVHEEEHGSTRHCRRTLRANVCTAHLARLDMDGLGTDGANDNAALLLLCCPRTAVLRLGAVLWWGRSGGQRCGDVEMDACVEIKV